jgi:hypothetical protein
MENAHTHCAKDLLDHPIQFYVYGEESMLNRSKVDKAEDYSRVKKQKRREPQQRTDDFFVVKKMMDFFWVC